MLSLRIALRYLFSKKSHQAVNIISYVSMAGIALASMAMVVVMSVFNGFSDFTEMTVSRLAPDIEVTPVKGKAFAGADALAVGLGELDGVADASPVITEKAFAIAGELQLPVIVKGVSPAAAADLAGVVIDGLALVGPVDNVEGLEGVGSEAAILSVGVANGLRSVPSVESAIKIYEPRRVGRINPSAPMRAFRVDSVFAAGVYRVDREEFDTDMIIISLDMARRLLSYDDQATAIEIRLAAGADLSAVKSAVAELAGPGFAAKDKTEQQEHAFRMIKIEKWVTLLMLTFILLIASFNILSTMSMLIVEKRGNMAIMTAMGATKRMVAGIFAVLSFAITAIGGAIGLVVGVLLALGQQIFGFIPLNAQDPTTMAITAYPVRVEAADIAVVALIVAVIGAATAAVIGFALRK